MSDDIVKDMKEAADKLVNPLPENILAMIRHLAPAKIAKIITEATEIEQGWAKNKAYDEAMGTVDDKESP